MRDDLVVDVLGEVEVTPHVRGVGALLLERRRRGEDGDAVALDLADDQVALLGIGSGINTLMLGVQWQRSLVASSHPEPQLVGQETI